MLCKECKHFDTAVAGVCWCKKLVVPLHEEADPCILFEACTRRKKPVIPVVSAAVIRKSTTNLQPKKAVTNVRIKCFAD